MAADDAGLPGQLIASRYRLGNRIGEGGMGVVYAAFDEQLRRPVAVKFLPSASQTDDDRLGRFRNEARTLSALNHPLIVTIFEIGQTEATPFIAMELVDGETLRARLRAGRLPLRDAIDIALQVARALGAAHAKGIVHRDIKPENVMMRRDGYIKVLDFGVAILRAYDQTTESMVSAGSLQTVMAGRAGTPAYMSPEQIDARPLDARSDLFSLGVLLCEPRRAGRRPGWESVSPAAYAEFAGKTLPVIAQGYKAMPPLLDRFAVAESNLSGTPAPVGQFAGLGPFGTFDLIGNVREWYWNAANDDLRYTLGRQANSYGPEALSPFDRSALNGLRCVRNGGPVPEEARAPREMLRRDFSTARPVSDAAFKIYRDMYAYDPTPLNAASHTMPDPSADWTREKVTFNAGSSGERLSAYLFVPKHTKPPFQAVVFFPSARVNFLTSSADLGDMTFVDYVIKSGRAVIYPVYQKLYERRSATVTLPGPTLQRAVLVDWRRDVGRSIDYLETRDDIDKNRIGYLGVSQGAAYGVVVAALEDRLKAVVFLDGGMFQQTSALAGLDQVDFAPRLTKPVLMVNGRYDATFPYESAQLPLFRLLGTAAADKRHVVFDTPHDVRLRRTDLVREVLNWYEKYLGKVQ